LLVLLSRPNSLHKTLITHLLIKLPHDLDIDASCLEQLPRIAPQHFLRLLWYLLHGLFQCSSLLCDFLRRSCRFYGKVCFDSGRDYFWVGLLYWLLRNHLWVGLLYWLLLDLLLRDSHRLFNRHLDLLHWVC
jgi:hypothetical protein